MADRIARPGQGAFPFQPDSLKARRELEHEESQIPGDPFDIVSSDAIEASSFSKGVSRDVHNDGKEHHSSSIVRISSNEAHSSGSPGQIPDSAAVEKIFLRDEQSPRGKREIIESMIEAGSSKKEKIYRRLEKYPLGALELLEKNHVKIKEKPLDFFDKDIGRYDSSNDSIRVGRGVYMDYFIDHPGISSFFSGKYPAAVKAGSQFAFVASALAIFTLPLSLSVAAIAGAALVPLSLLLLSKVRERTVKNPLEHEVAHALDVALGRSETYRNLPVCDRIASDPSIPHYNHLEENIPFSLKSPEVVDLYESCKNGRDGAKFVTLYASDRVEEYFAESVRAYLNTKKMGNDVSREDLREKDPAMYRFVEKLFRDIDTITS